MAQPGKEQSRRLNIAISSNTGTGTATQEWTLSRWIRVIPVAETDSYDVTLKDADGHIMLYRTGQIGTLSENIEMSLGILKTVLIANATQDGTYVIKFDLH